LEKVSCLLHSASPEIKTPQGSTWRGLELETDEKRLKELDLFSLQNRQLQEDFVAGFIYLVVTEKTEPGSSPQCTPKDEGRWTQTALREILTGY